MSVRQKTTSGRRNVPVPPRSQTLQRPNLASQPSVQFKPSDSPISPSPGVLRTVKSTTKVNVNTFLNSAPPEKNIINPQTNVLKKTGNIEQEFLKLGEGNETHEYTDSSGEVICVSEGKVDHKYQKFLVISIQPWVTIPIIGKLKQCSEEDMDRIVDISERKKYVDSMINNPKIEDEISEWCEKYDYEHCDSSTIADYISNLWGYPVSNSAIMYLTWGGCKWKNFWYMSGVFRITIPNMFGIPHSFVCHISNGTTTIYHGTGNTGKIISITHLTNRFISQISNMEKIGDSDNKFTHEEKLSCVRKLFGTDFFLTDCHCRSGFDSDVIINKIY